MPTDFSKMTVAEVVAWQQAGGHTVEDDVASLRALYDKLTDDRPGSAKELQAWIKSVLDTTEGVLSVPAYQRNRLEQKSETAVKKDRERLAAVRALEDIEKDEEAPARLKDRAKRGIEDAGERAAKASVRREN